MATSLHNVETHVFVLANNAGEWCLVQLVGLDCEVTPDTELVDVTSYEMSPERRYGDGVTIRLDRLQQSTYVVQSTTSLEKQMAFAVLAGDRVAARALADKIVNGE